MGTASSSSPQWVPGLSSSWSKGQAEGQGQGWRGIEPPPSPIIPISACSPSDSPSPNHARTTPPTPLLSLPQTENKPMTLIEKIPMSPMVLSSSIPVKAPPAPPEARGKTVWLNSEWSDTFPSDMPLVVPGLANPEVHPGIQGGCGRAAYLPNRPGDYPKEFRHNCLYLARSISWSSKNLIWETKEASGHKTIFKYKGPAYGYSEKTYEVAAKLLTAIFSGVTGPGRRKVLGRLGNPEGEVPNTPIRECLEHLLWMELEYNALNWRGDTSSTLAKSSMAASSWLRKQGALGKYLARRIYLVSDKIESHFYGVSKGTERSFLEVVEWATQWLLENDSQKRLYTVGSVHYRTEWRNPIMGFLEEALGTSIYYPCQRCYYAFKGERISFEVKDGVVEVFENDTRNPQLYGYFYDLRVGIIRDILRRLPPHLLPQMGVPLAKLKTWLQPIDICDYISIMAIDGLGAKFLKEEGNDSLIEYVLEKLLDGLPSECQEPVRNAVEATLAELEAYGERNTQAERVTLEGLYEDLEKSMPTVGTLCFRQIYASSGVGSISGGMVFQPCGQRNGFVSPKVTPFGGAEMAKTQGDTQAASSEKGLETAQVNKGEEKLTEAPQKVSVSTWDELFKRMA